MAASAPLDQLPDSKCPTLVLDHPTKAEHLGLLKKNGASWRGALSLGAYLKREEHLASQPLTRNGGISYWVLVDSAAKDRVVLCGCETFRKPALVARNGQVRDVFCHGIGSVFCPKEHRGRGYAARMMRELGKMLQTYQDQERGPILFSILYSDIGKEFYAAHGWEPFNSSHIAIHTAGPVAASAPPPSTLPTAQPLTAADIPPFTDLDTQLLRARLCRRSSSPSANSTAIALLPDDKTIQWHHAREEFVAAELHCETPSIKGAIVGDQPGHRVWCYWTRMWYNSNPDDSRDNTLHVLRLVIEDAEPGEEMPCHPPHSPGGVNESNGTFITAPTTNGVNGVNGANGTNGVNGHSHTNGANGINGSNGVNGHHNILRHVPAIEALLRFALKEAEKWKMQDVEIWNPSTATVAAVHRIQSDARVVDRDQESIASLMWYGEQLPGMGEDGKAAELIDWVGNEKYGWC